MRAAVFEPLPHVCGPAAMVDHIRAGFKTLPDWDADFITFTKSGKPSITWGDDGMRFGLRWWRTKPDVTAKIKDAVDILNSYDLIILTEPRHMTLDAEAVKADTVPYYVEVLEKVTKPWTTVLCGPLFQEERAPFLVPLKNAPACLGFVASGADCAATSPYLDPASVPVVSYPFEARSKPWDTTLRRPVIGMTGRVVPNKGQGLMAHVADRTPHGYATELHGSASIGTGPNFTYLIWEHLKELGWVGEREDRPSDSGMRSNVGPDILRSHPWWAEKSSRHISYHGGYYDGSAVCNRLGIHVSLTDSKFSSGVEFVLLEAIDAGCYPVMLSHLAVEPWDAEVLAFTSPPSMSKLSKGKGDDEIDMLLKATEAATNIVDDDLLRSRATRHNREVLHELHDPAKWCAKVMRSVGYS